MRDEFKTPEKKPIWHPEASVNRMASPNRFNSSKLRESKDSWHVKRSPFALVRSLDIQQPAAKNDDAGPGPCYEITGKVLDQTRPRSTACRFGRTEKPDIWFPFKQQLEIPGAGTYIPKIDSSVKGSGVFLHTSHESYYDAMRTPSPGPKYYPKLKKHGAQCVIGKSKGHDIDEFFIPHKANYDDFSSEFFGDVTDLAKAMDYLLPRSCVIKISSNGGSSRKAEEYTPGPCDYDPKVAGAFGKGGARISSSVLERATDAFPTGRSLEKVKIPGRKTVTIKPRGAGQKSQTLSVPKC